MAGDRKGVHLSWRRLSGQPDWREVFRAPRPAALGQDLQAASGLACEMFSQAEHSCFPQPARPLPDRGMGNLRHPRRRRARTW